MVEVVRKRKESTFDKVKDGEFFLFCDNLYFKSGFYNENEIDFSNAYCFEVDDNHYTFFEDNDIVEPIDVKIVVMNG